MIREDRFVQSRQPYAVDLDSFRREPGGSKCTVRAVWFRRRRAGYNGPMLTVACAGELWESLWQRPGWRPATARAFCAMASDGRYGGDCRARWDGTELWAPGMSEPERAAVLEILAPMLRNYPNRPPGYQGWYTFHA